MNSRIMGLRVAGAFFALFALAHLGRLVLGWEVALGPHQIPMSVSVIAALLAAALSFWMWKLAAREG